MKKATVCKVASCDTRKQSFYKIRCGLGAKSSCFFNFSTCTVVAVARWTSSHQLFYYASFHKTEWVLAIEETGGRVIKAKSCHELVMKCLGIVGRKRLLYFNSVCYHISLTVSLFRGKGTSNYSFFSAVLFWYYSFVYLVRYQFVTLNKSDIM